MSDEDEYHYSEEEDVEMSQEEEQKVEKHRRPGALTSTFSREEKQAEMKYWILERDTILQQQQRLVRDMKDLLNTSDDETLRILMEYRWNKEGLMEDYFKCGLDRLRERAGVSTKAPPTSKCCGICYDDMTRDNSLTNSFCKHTFCKDCWRHHVLVKVNDGHSRRITCMQEKCSSVVDQHICNTVLLGSAEKARYDQALIDSFIEDNPRVKWCCSVPCCGRAIELSDSVSLRTDCECACEEIFCFSCYNNTHSPVPCEWAKLWNEKNSKESANAIYISLNCKPCPKCSKMIQKGDGCNHVTCVCGQHMCWLCGAATGRAHDMLQINGHVCEKHRPEKALLEATAKQQLDTYIHYYDKFAIHMQSLQKAKEVETRVNQTIEALNYRTGAPESVRDADWLWIGLKQLFRMRRFIAWTYVFAYYGFYGENGKRIQEFESKRHNNSAYFTQTLFEDLQAQLQESIEILSRFVEMKPEDMGSDTKANVLQVSNKTHQLAINLWKFISEDVLSNALNSYSSLPMYFPIRRMVSGLGAVGINEFRESMAEVLTSSSSTQSPLRTAKAPVTAKEVIDLTEASPEKDRRKKKNKHG